MTAHDHRTFVEGCYRCELSRDEVRREYVHEGAVLVGHQWWDCPDCRKSFTSPGGLDIHRGADHADPEAAQ